MFVMEVKHHYIGIVLGWGLKNTSVIPRVIGKVDSRVVRGSLKAE